MTKKLLFMLVFSILITGFIYGQDGPPRRPHDNKKMPSPEEMAARELGDLKDALSLNDDQVPFVKKILQDFYKNMQSLFDSNEMNPDNMDKIVADKDSDMKSVLTDDQWTKYLDFKEKHKNKFKPGPGDHGPGDKPPDRQN